MLSRKLMSPCAYRRTFFERCVPTWVKPIFTNRSARASGSGPVNSTNSKPLRPIGLSCGSVIAKAPDLVSSETISLFAWVVHRTSQHGLVSSAGLAHHAHGRDGDDATQTRQVPSVPPVDRVEPRVGSDRHCLSRAVRPAHSGMAAGRGDCGVRRGHAASAGHG